MLRMVSRPAAETVEQLPQEHLPGFVDPTAPDGANRRPLPFDNMYHRKPAYWALHQTLQHAPHRKPLWNLGTV